MPPIRPTSTDKTNVNTESPPPPKKKIPKSLKDCDEKHAETGGGSTLGKKLTVPSEFPRGVGLRAGLHGCQVKQLKLKYKSTVLLV